MGFLLEFVLFDLENCTGVAAYLCDLMLDDEGAIFISKQTKDFFTHIFKKY